MALDYVPAKVPVFGDVLSIVLEIFTTGVLSFCLTRRTQYIKNWSRLPLAQWLILIIYVDSALFVIATSIMAHGFGVNSSRAICEGGILLCLTCYMSAKVVTYYFLVERAYIVGGSRKPRFKTKLWLFNCLFMILPYTIFVILNFIYRITYINQKGVCIIGMQKIAMLPLIVFEVIVNVYLTLLFIIPLRALHSYKTNANPALNRMAFRSFVGSCATLTASVINLTVIMVLQGEPAWICFLCCNSDILFCISVLHWVTSKEQREEDSAFRSGTGHPKAAAGTVGSNRDRSRRVSVLLKEEQELENGSASSFSGKIPTTTTVSHLQSSSAGTMTTEIKSNTHHPTLSTGLSRVLHRRGSSRDGSEGKHVLGDDEVELNNIRVQTTRTTEVEVDSEGKRWATASSDGGDEWVASRRGVVGERIV